MTHFKKFLLATSFLVFAGCSSTSSTSTTTSTSTSTSPTASSTYTLANISKHASASDCWLVIDNSVYNVTDFVTKHPGGAEILKGCGKDASSLFHNQPKHAGPEAQSLLPEFKIGTLQ